MDSDDYRASIEYALIAAIIRVSKDPATGIPILRVGEVCDAMTDVLAGVLTMSPDATSSPTKVRRTVDDFGKLLQRRIVGIQQAGGVPMRFVDTANVHHAPTARH